VRGSLVPTVVARPFFVQFRAVSCPHTKRFTMRARFDLPVVVKSCVGLMAFNCFSKSNPSHAERKTDHSNARCGLTHGGLGRELHALRS